MTWILFAFVCAAAEGVKDLFSKHSLGTVSSEVVTWIFFLVTTILLLPVLFFIDIPSLDIEYFFYLALQGVLFGLSIHLYMKAISLSSLSVTIPLIMFTPAYLLLIGPFTLNESPSNFGILGTLLIVAGSYLLNIRSISGGVLKPIKALLNETGSRIMLLVSFIWSITGTIDKYVISEVKNPLFWGISLYIVISIYLTFRILYKKRVPTDLFIKKWKVLLSIGIFNSVQLAAFVLAIETGIVAYVVAIKRTSVLIVLVLGSYFFGNMKIMDRIPAVLIMLAGVFLIAMYS